MKKKVGIGSVWSQSGQIGVIIVLIMVVVLTIGVSVGVRTTQQQEISIEQQEAGRVFQAAESGLEHALARIFGYEKGEEASLPSETVNLTNEIENANVQYEIQQQSTLSTYLEEGAVAEAPLAGLSGGNTIDVVWTTSPDDCTVTPGPAAMLISVFFQDDSGTIMALQYAVDGCAANRGNSFSTPSQDSGLPDFRHRLTLPNNPLYARIRPLYNDTSVTVEGLDSSVTSQYNISARARSTQTGLETKAVTVEQTILTAPSVMDFVLVSGNTIIK